MIKLLSKQIGNFFYLENSEILFLEKHYLDILNETMQCLKKNNNNYYHKSKYIDPLHTNSWAMFLYKFSRFCFEEGQVNLAEKLYYLNKIMNSVELFYEVQLPKYFIFDHPLGSVMGRAKYGEYFMFSQGCTVGNNKGVYPVLGEYLIMMSNSKIIGNCKIGNNCIISANTYIKDTDVPDNTIVFGYDRNIIFKENKNDNSLNWMLEGSV